jgi:hypothetical protein
MAFVRDGCHICWSAADIGERPTTLMMAEADLMDDLLAQFPLLIISGHGPYLRERVKRSFMDLSNTFTLPKTKKLKTQGCITSIKTFKSIPQAPWNIRTNQQLNLDPIV